MKRLASEAIYTAITWMAASALAAAGQSTAEASDPRSSEVVFQINAQPMEGALKEFAAQAHLQLIYETTEAGLNLQSSNIDGVYTPTAALARLLAHTNLNYKFINNQTVSIRRAEATTGASSSAVREASSSKAPMRFADSAPADLRSASTESKVWGNAVAEDNARSGTRQKDLDEVVVTAQKRSERLQDVPVPVSALDANSLAESDQNRLQDYFSSVPGLNLSAGGGGGGGGLQTLAIRGMTTGNNTNPTVGVMIDDVPYGTSTVLGQGGVLYPDIDPSDLARIEVLRGPQGTLYGASSIGGLIKFVTADPSTDRLTGRVQILGNDVQHGDFGYGVRGSVNLPLSDTIAVRASAFTRRDPGYVDNITTGQRDTNRADTSGGRLSALWQFSDTASLKLSALLQNTTGDGTAAVDTDAQLHPVLGDLQQSRMRGTEEYDVRVRLYTATLTAKLGSLDLMSISGYGTNSFSDTQDATLALGGLAEFGFPDIGFNGFGVSGASQYNSFETKKLTQELRLLSDSKQMLEWILGAFYTHESTQVNQAFLGNDFTTGTPAGSMITYDVPSTVAEYALFGDLTAHITDRFDIQVGARESYNRQTYAETDEGPLVPLFDSAPSPVIQPTEHANANAFTYLATPRLKISPDLMIYARFASGYRLGGPNYTASFTHVPLTYAPDKANNYEIGVKGDLLDRMVTFDASAYYIAWKHIQIFVTNPDNFATYYANGGNAKSQGAELSVQVRPVRGLTLQAVASLNNAELTQDLPATATAVGFAGDRLPYSSRFSGNLSADQDVVITNDIIGFLGGSMSYVGERQGEFPPNTTQSRVLLPAYALMNLRAGVRTESWTVSVFGNNLADRRGVVGGGVGIAESPYFALYTQPRTIGLSVTKAF